MKKIFKQQYGFGNSDKYRLFIKKNILKLSPRYYSVSSSQEVDTHDGQMYAVKIITDIDNPSLEPIVECFINEQYVYLWRDLCWMPAVDKNGRLIVSPPLLISYDINNSVPQCNKVLVIHQIGNDTVE